MTEYKKELLDELFNTEDNLFKLGDMVSIEKLCDVDGNEVEDIYEITSVRRADLFKEGKIDFIFGNDFDGGYVYGIEGSIYCFNKYELKYVEEE